MYRKASGCRYNRIQLAADCKNHGVGSPGPASSLAGLATSPPSAPASALRASSAAGSPVAAAAAAPAPSGLLPQSGMSPSSGTFTLPPGAAPPPLAPSSLLPPDLENNWRIFSGPRSSRRPSASDFILTSNFVCACFSCWISTFFSALVACSDVASSAFGCRRNILPTCRYIFASSGIGCSSTHVSCARLASIVFTRMEFSIDFTSAMMPCRRSSISLTCSAVSSSTSAWSFFAAADEPGPFLFLCLSLFSLFFPIVRSDD
mmetsp:Transcript_27875/g.78882  ORF Transcript_27875/g.78882 Transcript_27875/m.78882 type:complete len:261 (+) Transcript_27875:25-807(+)